MFLALRLQSCVNYLKKKKKKKIVSTGLILPGSQLLYDHIWARNYTRALGEHQHFCKKKKEDFFNCSRFRYPWNFFYLYVYRAWTIIIQDRRIMQLIDRVGAEVRPMLLVLRLHLLMIILECQRGCVTAQCSQYIKNNSIVIPARLFPNHPRWSLKIKRFSERLLWYYVYFVRGIILQTLWRDINKLKIKK